MRSPWCGNRLVTGGGTIGHQVPGFAREERAGAPRTRNAQRLTGEASDLGAKRSALDVASTFSTHPPSRSLRSGTYPSAGGDSGAGMYRSPAIPSAGGVDRASAATRETGWVSPNPLRRRGGSRERSDARDGVGFPKSPPPEGWIARAQRRARRGGFPQIPSAGGVDRASAATRETGWVSQNPLRRRGGSRERSDARDGVGFPRPAIHVYSPEGRIARREAGGLQRNCPACASGRKTRSVLMSVLHTLTTGNRPVPRQSHRCAAAAFRCKPPAKVGAPPSHQPTTHRS